MSRGIYSIKRDNELSRLGLSSNWRKARDVEDTYTLPIYSKRRSVNSEGVPRLNYDTKNGILNVWCPSKAEGEIDVHRTRLKVSYALKEVLHPQKYFTFIQRDSKVKFKKDVAYTVDYYAKVDGPPDNEKIDRIMDICQNPVVL